MRVPAGGLPRRPLRIALIGWGAIARRFVRLVIERNPAAVEIVAAATRTPSALPYPRLASPDDLAGLQADWVVEAAGRDAVVQWGPAALAHTRCLVVASTSALTDDALLGRLVGLAEQHGSQLVIPPGALAGIDGLAAASRLGLDSVMHSIAKPPQAWRGTPAEQHIALDDVHAATTVFTGSAREAARRFPQNANVAVISAMAGIGLDRTVVSLIADPGLIRNVHRIDAVGEFGTLSMTIENRPLAANPKSSEMTALSLVRLVENRIRPLSC